MVRKISHLTQVSLLRLSSQATTVEDVAVTAVAEDAEAVSAERTNSFSDI